MRRLGLLCRLFLCAVMSGVVQGRVATADTTLPAWASDMGAEIAHSLATACPRAALDDQKALDACRDALQRSPLLDQVLAPFLLWGGGDGVASLKTNLLTQFNGDVFRSLYLPLFVFSGAYRVEIADADDMPVVRLQATFRNNLGPGSYPYPFWHVAQKWQVYEGANELIFYLDRERSQVIAVVRSRSGRPDEAIVRQSVPVRPFDGKWTWTSADGAPQPAMSLFESYFRPENPHARQVSDTYRAFALNLREGQCLECHVPNNPNKMKRLVLLQTPLHAAGEIERVLEDVRKGRMPRSEWGDAKPLSPERRAAFLELGGAFARALAQARDWEALNR